MHIQLAWRNMWRNPRRTAVIMMAVIIGVWSMIFLGALMRGVADQMIRNGIATLTGHIQVHRKGYGNDPVIENSIDDPEVVETTLERLMPAGVRWSSRIRVRAVAMNARHSGGVTLGGIHPAQEARVSFIGQAVTEGRYLKPDDEHGILVGKALADKFETTLGRKLVLMSQDTGRDVASRAFRIVGIFRAEMAATEKQFVFVTRPAAQQMLKLERGISEISILLPSHKGVNQAAKDLRAELSSSYYEVQTWQEILPLTEAYLRIYEQFIFLWFVVVFIAMGFGIVNTMLMAVFERIREFGLLKALGMKPWWIVLGVLTESCFLLLIGMALGNALGLLSVLALSSSGIDLSALGAGLEFAGMSRVVYPAIYGRDLSMANLVVFTLGLLVSLYPALRAARFAPVEALART